MKTFARPAEGAVRALLPRPPPGGSPRRTGSPRPPGARARPARTSATASFTRSIEASFALSRVEKERKATRGSWPKARALAARGPADLGQGLRVRGDVHRAVGVEPDPVLPGHHEDGRRALEARAHLDDLEGGEEGLGLAVQPGHEALGLAGADRQRARSSAAAPRARAPSRGSRPCAGAARGTPPRTPARRGSDAGSRTLDARRGRRPSDARLLADGGRRARPGPGTTSSRSRSQRRRPDRPLLEALGVDDPRAPSLHLRVDRRP